MELALSEAIHQDSLNHPKLISCRFSNASMSMRAFPFNSRDQLELGCKVIYNHFACFGLEMHIGRTANGKETASKTECVFFPRPSYFSKKKNAPALTNEPFDGSIVQSVPVAKSAPVEKHTPSFWERREASAERAKKKAELEKTRYFSLDQTQPIAVKDGFVTFTMHFEFLGSFISYNLWDDFNIDLRIKMAGQAMGALKHFFKTNTLIPTLNILSSKQSHSIYYYGDVRPGHFEKITTSN